MKHANLLPLLWLALVLWVGALWALGYIAVPALFSGLADKMLAGQIAGRIFALQGWVGLACGVAAIGIAARCWSWREARVLFVVLGLMLAASLAIQFGLQPEMAALKQSVAPEDIMKAALRERFMWLHGLSSSLYLLESLLGLGAVWWLAKRPLAASPQEPR